MLRFTQNIYIRVGHVLVDKHGDSFTVTGFKYDFKENITHVVAKCNTDEEVRKIAVAELENYILEF